MSIKRKALLIQAAGGAVVLTLVMQPVFMLGYGSYVWILFTALILFFAMGADLKKIPSTIVSFACGLAWGALNGVLMEALSGAPMWVSGILLTMVMIFSMLTVHENLLRDTIVGNVPGLFMGFALTFYMASVQTLTPTINQLHLFVFFIYGMVMSVLLVKVGGFLCTKILGNDWPKYVYGGAEEPSK